jgi:hypothetical protein
MLPTSIMFLIRNVNKTLIFGEVKNIKIKDDSSSLKWYLKFKKAWGPTRKLYSLRDLFDQ